MRLRKSYTEKNKTTMSCFELMPFKTQLSNTIKGTTIVCSVRSVSLFCFIVSHSTSKILLKKIFSKKLMKNIF